MKYTLKLLDKTAFGDNGYRTAGTYYTDWTKQELVNQLERDYTGYRKNGVKREGYKLTVHRQKYEKNNQTKRKTVL